MEKRVSSARNSPILPDSRVGDSSAVYRIFLLSPANLKGIRGQRLLNSATHSELGNRLRAQGAFLAELFCHTSSLYFRGKLAYARFFATAPLGVEGCYVITSSRGLLTPDTVVDIETARDLASGGDINLEDDRYRIPLRRDAEALGKNATEGLPGCSVRERRNREIRHATEGSFRRVFVVSLCVCGTWRYEPRRAALALRQRKPGACVFSRAGKWPVG